MTKPASPLRTCWFLLIVSLAQLTFEPLKEASNLEKASLNFNNFNRCVNFLLR